MKSKLLLPNRFKTLGWWILIPATIAGIIVTASGYEVEWLTATVFAFFGDNAIFDSNISNNSFTFITTNVTSTLVGVLWIVGGLMVSFSKEKKEDEFIANLRLSSLLWSVWVNYVLLILAFLFIWGLSFFTVMVYNMFTILIIFIIRFNFIIHRNSKLVSDEK